MFREMAEIAVVGLLLILAGVAVLVVATLLSSKQGGGETKGAGVLMIGPVPIVFGSDAKWASVAIALAIVLILVSFLLYVV